MNIPSFFRFLNSKIEKYDKMTINPFMTPQSVVLVWIEDCSEELYCKDKEIN